MNPGPFALMADAEVSYEGRASSTLQRGIYLVMYKPDGSLSIHGSRAKPLNYQNGGSRLIWYDRGREFSDLYKSLLTGKPKFIIWSENRDETLTIGVYAVYSQMPLDGLSDYKIVLQRSERDLVHKVLINLIDYFPDVEMLVAETEVQTPYGYIDLLILDSGGMLHIVEFKRKIVSVAGCGQVARYARHLRDERGLTVREYVAAPAITRNAADYAGKNGQTYIYADF